MERWVKRTPKKGGALIPQSSFNRPNGLVDTDSFPLYLQKKFNPTLEEVSFARHLDLGIFTPYLEELYDFKPEVYYFSSDYRKELQARERSFNQIYFNEAGKQAFIDSIRETANRKAVAERGRVIYRGLRGGIHATKIEFGDHTSVGMQRSYLRVASHLGSAITDIHTHPGNELPSVNDFKWLVIGYASKRLLRASLVLCPDIQILSVATPSSPLFSNKEWAKWRDFCEQDLYRKEKDRVDALNQRVQNLQTTPVKRIEAKNESLRQVFSKLENGELTSEQISKTAEELLDSLSDDPDKDRINKILARARLKYDTQLYQMYNMLSLRVARDLNILMYTSFNNRDFILSTA